MNIKKRLAFISAYLNGYNEDFNLGRHAFLIELLNDFNIWNTECIGKYNGIEEKSLMCWIQDDKDYNNILMLMRIFKQECVLMRDSNDLWYLHFNDGHTQSLGDYIELSIDKLDKCDYTYVPLTDKYFTIKEKEII